MPYRTVKYSSNYLVQVLESLVFFRFVHFLCLPSKHLIKKQRVQDLYKGLLNHKSEQENRCQRVNVGTF